MKKEWECFFNDFDWIVGESLEKATSIYADFIGVPVEDQGEYREVPLDQPFKMHFDCRYDLEKTGLSVSDAINEDAEVEDYYIVEKTMGEWIEILENEGQDFDKNPLLSSTEY